MIEVTSLVKRFGSFLALDHLNFQVGENRVVGFLGLNGAGKTTTLRILSCFTPPTSGQVRIAGFDSVRESDAVRQRIGYLPERVPLYDDLRVVEYLSFRARLKGVRGRDLKPALDRVLSRCGLEARRRSPIGTLSKGYRQRVGLADALIHEPALLLLDEPTSGLDPDQRIEVRKLIRDQAAERTVLLSTHILSEAEAICDDVIIIHSGRIKASGPLSNFCGGPDAPVRVRYRTSSSLAEENSSENPGGSERVVSFPSEKEASLAVSELVAAGHSLLEMTADAQSLEKAFIRLTTAREEST
ncbi:MAG TPA: ABC transporter ATP-binding protein [Planctomycetota bacterium]|jgi:ABC-2 type transport system ATP-binding protein|nr:ABC transporter ATP-binding protein [Planctomycetota bacterium]